MNELPAISCASLLTLVAATPGPITDQFPADAAVPILRWLSTALLVAAIGAAVIGAKSVQKDKWQAVQPWLSLVSGIAPAPLALMMGKQSLFSPTWCVPAIVCCSLAGIGLTSKVRDLGERLVVSGAVFVGFIVFNGFVATMVGCSGGGRISP